MKRSDLNYRISNYLQMKANGVFLLLMLGILFSCKREGDNIFNLFEDVSVTLHVENDFNIGTYKDVAVGDSIYVDFTINSKSKDMHQVWIFYNGAGAAALKIPLGESEKRSFRYVYKLRADKVGEATFRIMAVDREGVFMGDGYTSVTYNVRSDYVHLINRNLYMPDSVDRSSACFIDLMEGKTYTYAEAKRHPEKIDLGMYRTYTVEANGNVTYKYNIYSLQASPIPFGAFDFTELAGKGRTTYFSSLQNNQASAFLNTLTSGAVIQSNAVSRKTGNLKLEDLKVGSLFYFKTADDKYGAVIVNALSGFDNNRYLNLSIKRQN
ncbi:MULTISPECIES: hypothetical protein [Sphingobacterium]|uniref:hypothetical protein n=1 Tax=Sphingobacterium TaxID=28453 RepID=UPI002242F996|nr:MULTISPECIES: hypothetical protein [Sphingobacterium]MCW8310802.1 hypothetical protein [Sphingobacterium sp. InxBP1]